MTDSYVETINQSYGSRIKSSFKAVIVGIIFVAISMGALIWNESNLVQARKALEESESLLTPLPTIDSIDSEYEGSLVYLTGFAGTPTSLTDATFGVSIADTLKISRSVEMYQWVEKTNTETEKNLGGSTTTTKTYSHEKKWMDWIVPTEEFHVPAGHENPDAFPFDRSTSLANDATIGAFTLSEDVLRKMYDYEDVKLPSSLLNDIPEETKSNLVGEDKTFAAYGENGIYVGAGTEAEPKVGDVRVTFSRVPAQTITLIAEQEGKTFGPFKTSNDRDILLVESGTLTSEEMFDEANKDTTNTAWIVRGVCFFVMWIAFWVIADPLSVFADVVPFLGNCVDRLAGIISFIVALCVSLVTIALAWLFFRPVFSLCIFVGVGVVFCGLSMLKGKKDKGYEEISLAEDPEAGKGSYTDAVVS